MSNALKRRKNSNVMPAMMFFILADDVKTLKVR